MKNKNIGVNMALNVFKTALSIVFPLITYPYALRVLGVERIGAVSYVQSIINYFSLFAMLGVSSYAIREGAKIRDDKKSLTTFSNEVFTINIITTAISYLALTISILFVEKFSAYTILFIISSGIILFNTLSVDWINTIFEDYAYITIRSIFINMLSMLILFVFVKKPEDYYIYAALHTVTTGTICLTNWIYCRRYVKLKITLSPNFRRHLKKLIILFANALAISIYVNFDTTMLGWIKGDYAVGLYSASTKIYSVIKGLMIAVYSVTIPRLAAFIGQSDMTGFKKLYMKLWSGLSILLIPAGIGLASLSKEIILLFGGESYRDASMSLCILAIALIFSIYGGLVTACLNITIGREKDNLIATLFSAAINCGLNILFIPLYSQNGAAITTLIAELFVFAFCFIRLPNKNRYFDFSIIRKYLTYSIVGAVMVFIVCIVIKSFSLPFITCIIVSIIISILLYSIFLLILKEPIVFGFIRTVKER